jgi:hypothetical protein
VTTASAFILSPSERELAPLGLPARPARAGEQLDATHGSEQTVQGVEHLVRLAAMLLPQGVDALGHTPIDPREPSSAGGVQQRLRRLPRVIAGAERIILYSPIQVILELNTQT